MTPRFVTLGISLAAAVAGWSIYYREGLPQLGWVGVRVTDDVYYYLEIARNVAAGQGSTFDGIHPTNGYHPLWFLSLLPLAALYPGDDELMFVTGIWYGLLWSATGYLLARLAMKAGLGLLSAVATIVWVFYVSLYSFLFTEAAISSTFCVLTFLLLAEAPETQRARRGHALALGGVLGLAVLARLDNAVTLVPVVFATVLWRARLHFRRALVPGLILGAASASVVLPFVLWNQTQYGSPLPISAQMKHSDRLEELSAHGGLWSWPEIRAGVGRVLTNTEEVSLPVCRMAQGSGGLRDECRESGWSAGYLALLALPWLLRRRTPVGPPPPSRPAPAAVLAPLFVFALLHFLLFTLYAFVLPRAWYWVPEALAFSLLIPLSLQRLFEGLATRLPFPDSGSVTPTRIVGILSIVTLVLMVMPLQRVLGLGQPLPRPYADPVVRGALTMAGSFTPAHRGAAWNAGFAGYFFPGSFINLDGLVNAPDFGDELRELGGWAGYLRAHGAPWLLDTPEIVEQRGLGPDVDRIVDLDGVITIYRLRPLPPGDPAPAPARPGCRPESPAPEGPDPDQLPGI